MGALPGTGRLGVYVSRFRTELLSSYVLTASRVGAWAVVSAILARRAGMDAFAEISVLRGVVTLLSYVGMALGPVMLYRLTRAGDVVPGSDGGRSADAPPMRVYVTGAVAFLVGLSGAGVLAMGLMSYWAGASDVWGMWSPALMMTLGMAARVLGECPGMLSQSRGLFARDNVAAAAGEWSWAVFVLLLGSTPGSQVMADRAALMFAISGLVVLALRLMVAHLPIERHGVSFWRAMKSFDVRMLVGLLVPAGALLAASVADYLYAPLNQVLIARLSDLADVRDYAPSLQVDAAMLLLTGAVAATMLPRLNRALAAGDVRAARRDYLVGTAVSAGVLVVAAIPVAMAAGPVLELWLGPRVSGYAAEVLPWVLVHTVIGGSSGVGRAVVLAAGRYRTYALVSLGFGLTNAAGVAAVLSVTDWGVLGVVGVTIATVSLRCLVWMPWYVLRLLRAGVTADSEGASKGGDRSAVPL